MSVTSITILTNQNELSYSGEKAKGDGQFGQTDGLHTVSAKLTNFQGRIYIEASIESDPQEADWFPLRLTDTTVYKQYPVGSPTGANGLGDTVTEAWTFRANILWVRARVDRSYLDPLPVSYDYSIHGSVEKILLNL